MPHFEPVLRMERNPKTRFSMSQLRVLLTGPSGRVGPHLLAAFEESYDLHTFDMVASERPQSHVGTLQDLNSLREAMRGIDVVVHLAATSDEAPFLEQLMPNNIEGMYKLMEAAHLEGVRRVVFASSVQTILYDTDNLQQPVDTTVLSPCSLYGVTKIFGEVLGQWYHSYKGMEFIAVRLGWFEPEERIERDAWINNIWISHRDAVQLFQKAVETPGIGYAIVNCVSNTPTDFLSLESARELLNYEPQDSVAEVLALSSAHRH
jgi:nucleoside-diphosphate-sugar epimerase